MGKRGGEKEGRVKHQIERDKRAEKNRGKRKEESNYWTTLLIRAEWK